MNAPRAARLGVPLALAGLVLVAGVLIPGFMSRANLTTILLHVSINGIIALGCTFVIITAGIDLSVGSLVGLAGVLAAATLTSSTCGWSWRSISTSRNSAAKPSMTSSHGD